MSVWNFYLKSIPTKFRKDLKKIFSELWHGQANSYGRTFRHQRLTNGRRRQRQYPPALKARGKNVCSPPKLIEMGVPQGYISDGLSFSTSSFASLTTVYRIQSDAPFHERQRRSKARIMCVHHSDLIRLCVFSLLLCPIDLSLSKYRQ